jgi:hypothetical protein
MDVMGLRPTGKALRGSVGEAVQHVPPILHRAGAQERWTVMVAGVFPAGAGRRWCQSFPGRAGRDRTNCSVWAGLGWKVEGGGVVESVRSRERGERKDEAGDSAECREQRAQREDRRELLILGEWFSQTVKE